MIDVFQNKIISLPGLLNKLRRFPSGKKIVFTNGCFDILHRGHVDYLAKARSKGDILVVGLNSDAGVRRLKGAGRPVQSLADRAAVLSALEAVDFVVPFSENTPEGLIQKIRPDVLVKGADWQAEDIVGSTFVRSYGGCVARIPLTPGRSTTRLLRKILGRR